jgi:tRNA G18 (ribose-2'-O)-methylase SpoU
LFYAGHVIVHVASIDDPCLNDYRNVPDPELLRSHGVFVAEGRHVVRRLLTQSRYKTRSLLLTPAAAESLADLLPRLDTIPVFTVSQEAMNAITGFNIHRGCLAIGERLPLPAWTSLARGARRLVVLEHVSNADNVGGIFRNAAAFGVDAVLLGPSCTDPLYRKAIRTSMGAALQIPFATIDEWPDDLRRLRAGGLHLVALTPAPEAQAIEALGPPDRAALLMGHEGHGLSAAALALADLRVRIPMAAGIDSLNVATAAAIALYALTPNRLLKKHPSA